MIDLDVTWIDERGKAKGTLRFDVGGVTAYIGRQQVQYPWAQLERVSFDDPGRTKASVAAIAAFGVAGLARRIAYTLVTLSGTGQDLFFEVKQPLAISRTFAYRLLTSLPQAAGRIFVDGVALTAADRSIAAAPQAPAAWYPDPHDETRLRWFDGTAWTEHYAPRA